MPVAGRRKLIVVSNRGPVSFDRDADGERIAGAAAAGSSRRCAASFAPRRDVDRQCDDRRGPRRRARGRRRAVEETRATGRPTGSASSCTTSSPTTGSTTSISNPTFWFLQHYLWGWRARRTSTRAASAWGDGYVPVNRAFADAVLAELDRKPGRSGLLPRLPPLPRAALRPRGAPDATLAHFVHIPWPQPTTGTCCRSDLRHDDPRGLLANDVVGFHTDRWRRNFLRAATDFVGAEVEDDVSRTRAGARRDGASDLGRPRRVRRAGRERGGARAGAADRRRGPRS